MKGLNAKQKKVLKAIKKWEEFHFSSLDGHLQLCKFLSKRKFKMMSSVEQGELS